ncbi:MAG TPA: carboxylesterase family protein [Streptosporangiaceae bacterium]
MSTTEGTAETAAGTVRGELAKGLTIWRGIPYAAPPVGSLRFGPPRPAEPWAGVLDTTARGQLAWQPEPRDMLTADYREQVRSEDCLYLNVTAPPEPSADPRGYPVLVWIHGGGYVEGSGGDPIVGDGEALARRGLVVVTFNYRLGALGFVYLADVLPQYADAGQAGFLDQVAVLRWVRDNIASFGGDPGRVTVYGESAGAKSVVNLLASPLATGLISRAISASGGEHLASPEQATRLRRRLLRALGLPADRADQLADVPAPELIAAQEAIATAQRGTWVWRPVLGGSGIPVRPVDAIAAGQAGGIPLLAGTNGNEGASYQLMDPTAAKQAPRVLAELFGGADADDMLAGYRQARPELDDTAINVAVLGDERYAIPTRRLALAQAAHAPVWCYRYDGCPPGVPTDLAGGHGLDLIAVWMADSFATEARAGDPQARLCLAMADAWAAFARGLPPGNGMTSERGGGPPMAARMPAWPGFDAADETTLILDAQPHGQHHPRAAQHAIWRDRTWQSGTWWPLEDI